MGKLIELRPGKKISADVLANAIKKYVDTTKSLHVVSLDSMYPELARMLKKGPVGGVTYEEIANIPLSSFPEEDIRHLTSGSRCSFSLVKNSAVDVKKQPDFIGVDLPTTPFKGKF